jgi:transcriptional regulator with XRE-family HTH domain
MRDIGDSTRWPRYPNEVVAYNLRRAREELGLTQAEAGRRLGRYLPKGWSAANFGMAEKWGGNRVRKFDADELVAFAQVFEKPVTWFFLPPEEMPQEATIHASGAARGVTTRTLLSLLLASAPSMRTAQRRRLAATRALGAPRGRSARAERQMSIEAEAIAARRAELPDGGPQPLDQLAHLTDEFAQLVESARSLQQPALEPTAATGTAAAPVTGAQPDTADGQPSAARACNDGKPSRPDRREPERPPFPGGGGSSEVLMVVLPPPGH